MSEISGNIVLDRSDEIDNGAVKIIARIAEELNADDTADSILANDLYERALGCYDDMLYDLRGEVRETAKLELFYILDEMSEIADSAGIVLTRDPEVASIIHVGYDFSNNI